EQPADLGARKVRVHEQPGALAEQRLQALVLQALADIGGCAALPHHRGRDRLAAAAIPDDGGFALIGDADRCYLVCSNAGVLQRGLADLDRGFVDLAWVVLYPTRSGIALRDFPIGTTKDVSIGVEDECRAARRSLIERQDS